MDKMLASQVAMLITYMRTSIPVLAVTAVAVAMLVTFAPLRADDAYIVARYATQWWRGHGLVYNAGEQVNMLTSPLHGGVSVALRAFSDNIVALYQVAAAVIVSATLLVVAWMRWHGNERVLFLALTIASPLVAFWTVGGLETPLLLAACTAIAFVCTKDTPASRDASLVVALSAVAVLTRYDAVLFVAPVALVCARRAKLAVAATVVVMAAWLAWTTHYYGDILPTSFYVKATSWSGRELALGVVYLASFAALSLVWVLLLIRSQRPNTTLRIALAVGLALELAYGVFAGTKHMMYLYRLFVPYLPALVIVLIPARPIRCAGVTAALVVAFQIAFGYFIYEKSQNPTLALLFTQDETFEFDRLGARHTATFLEAARAQATPIVAHWQQTGIKDRAPRIVVSTGGILPHELPDAYALELLASYRHRCRADIVVMADYQQVIYPLHDRDDVDKHRIASGQSLVARDAVLADGLRERPLDLGIDIWYEPRASPLTLSPRIDGDCVPARGELPSPPHR